MSVPVWPAELPRPLRESWQAQPDEARLRRPAEAGPPGYRRRFSSAARNVRLTIDVSRAEKAVFDTFFDETTRHGSLPFRMIDPTTDGWPLLSSGGAALAGATAPILMARTWLCLFGADLPVETLIGVRFRIAFAVSVLP